jgi:putative ABC transport system permease protein
LAVARVLAAFLNGVSPFDPMTFATFTIALFLVGLLASYIPARRATRVDPLTALRVE